MQTVPQPPALLPFPHDCRIGILRRRTKRFIIEFFLDGREELAHTNNSGSMLGLVRPGSMILVSKSAASNRKLAYTLELVRLDGPHEPAPAASVGLPPLETAVAGGVWVGVNTLTPNRLLRAAFTAGKLPWAKGYTGFKPEAKRGQSRLDALLTGPGLPPLWVECKNVTLVEDDMAAFPDAVTERGQKHLREMADISESGERAAFFYCIQRPDGNCFGPAEYIDPAYAELFYQTIDMGVEAHPHFAPITAAGIGLGPELPLAPRR